MGRTLYRFIDPAPHTMRSVSVNVSFVNLRVLAFVQHTSVWLTDEIHTGRGRAAVGESITDRHIIALPLSPSTIAPSMKWGRLLPPNSPQCLRSLPASDSSGSVTYMCWFGALIFGMLSVQFTLVTVYYSDYCLCPDISGESSSKQRRTWLISCAINRNCTTWRCCCFCWYCNYSH